jgi:hypothetical protein
MVVETSIGTWQCPYCLSIYASHCKEEALECEKTCLPDKEKYEKIRLESAERIRYLISLGHPQEKGEVYNRWVTMDECNRRGKALFIDLGWPVEPDSVYKNKYTGGEATLREEIYSLVMEQYKDKTFDEMFNIHTWAVLEHWYPKEKWVPDELLKDYKEKPKLTDWTGNQLTSKEINEAIEAGVSDRIKKELKETSTKKRDVNNQKISEWIKVKI